MAKTIPELESEIASLPAGYISKKTINGSRRLYYQWTENGKKKSKYVNDATATTLSAQIEKRRALKNKLKELKAQAPKRPAQLSLHSEVIIGENLRLFVERALSLKARPQLKALQKFLTAPSNGKILILYGLRRTGKTTLVQQAIGALDENEFKKAAFLQVRPGDTLATLNKDIKTILSQGVKYVFIDEVTLMEDFIEGAALFSDIFASCGIKIVLSGTDSLGFIFSANEQLYDRCEMLHTTFISYAEFESVLGIHGIDEYILYGGTMSLSGVNYNTNSTFSSQRSTQEYVDSAIARNIQHSLKFYQDGGHFRQLQDLYEKNELTSVINRIVEDINHRFTLDVLTQNFISHDLGISARNLRRDRENPTDILDDIDTISVTKGLKEALEIRNKNEQTVGITENHRTQVKEYLDLLDLTVDIALESFPVSETKHYLTVITQPGLRYAQAKALIRELLLDAKFQGISAVERKRIIDRILEEIRGRMMEEIVLLETKKAFPQKEVFKLKFAVGEFDMVIHDPEEVSCEIYEIKHSKEIAALQYRHLIDPQKCADTAFRFGEIRRKCVLYRGPSTSDGGIKYENVEEFLSKLPHPFAIDLPS